MTFTFTAEEWNSQLETPDGIQNGIRIPFNQYNIQEPIVQFYVEIGIDSFQIITPGVMFMAGFFNNELMISSANPFNIKINIK